MVVVYLSLRWRKLLLSSGCSSSKLKLDQLPRLSSPTLSCWDTEDSVTSLPGKLNPQRDEERKRLQNVHENLQIPGKLVKSGKKLM